MGVSFLAQNNGFMTYDASVTSSWICKYTQVYNPTGACVFVMSDQSSDISTGLTMNGVPLDAVTTYTKVGVALTSTIKAYFIGAANAAGRNAYWGKTPFSSLTGTATQLGGTARSCAYGNNRWCIGYNSDLMSSTDYTGTFTSIKTFTGEQIESIAYGNGYWVVITVAASAGSTGASKVYYATDPTSTWTQNTSISLPNTTAYANPPRNQIKFVNGYFVILQVNSLYYASDPTGSWTDRSSNIGANATARDVAYGNGYYVVVSTASSGPKTIYTTDLATTTWSTADTLGGNSIAYGRGYWVKIYGGILYTSDITAPSWTTATGSDIGINRVVFGNPGYGNSDLASERGVFLATGQSLGRVTTDPTNWKTTGVGISNSLFAYGSDSEPNGSTWLLCCDSGYKYAEALHIQDTKSSATGTFAGCAMILYSASPLEVNTGGITNTYRVINRGEQLIDDGNFGLDTNRNSIRLSAITAGNTNNLVGSLNSNQYGPNSTASYRHYYYSEATPGQGSRLVGTTPGASSQECIEMGLAVREVQTMRHMLSNGKVLLYNDGTSLKIVTRPV